MSKGPEEIGSIVPQESDENVENELEKLELGLKHALELDEKGHIPAGIASMLKARFGYGSLDSRDKQKLLDFYQMKEQDDYHKECEASINSSISSGIGREALGKVESTTRTFSMGIKEAMLGLNEQGEQKRARELASLFHNLSELILDESRAVNLKHYDRVEDALRVAYAVMLKARGIPYHDTFTGRTEEYEKGVAVAEKYLSKK